MNYLAHAFLSDNQHDLLVGNFIADHLRGNDLGVFSEGVVKGIHLHRSIDTFTDAHPLFRDSKRVFYNGFERYSGILVDIYFDHLLAKNFPDFSTVPLAEFSKRVYKIYTAHERILPLSSARFLGYVIKNNIYTSYGTQAGIIQVLNHLSHRIGHRVQLDDSFHLFSTHENYLEDNFKRFFQEAVSRFIGR